jgi:hypothetical protein
MLFLETPRNQIGSQKYTKIRCEMPVIKATSLIRIRICMKSERRARMMLKTKMKSTFQVPKNSLDRIPMNIFIDRGMHKLRSLIYGIRDVGTSNGDILKSVNHTSIKMRIEQGSTLKFRKRFPGYTWCIVWFSSIHLSMKKNITNVLQLRKVKVVRIRVNLNAQK